MREATGNALLVMMMTSIIAIIMIFFVGSISYSKSYRIKNYIINQIEENGSWNSILEADLETYFKEIGYSVRRTNADVACNKDKNNANNCGDNLYKGSYEACIYKCDNYYKVVTFMKFDFPVIGESLKFSVKGETKSFNDFN